MIAQLSILETLDNIIWGYVALPTLLIIGIYLCFKSRFVQIRQFPKILNVFFRSLTTKHSGAGVHPIKTFFVCIGGCMGIGNVVAVCTATQIGGPGALFWIWITALIGMILKYSEVFLGMRYRVPDGKGGYRGGPMYFLKHAFKSSWVPKIACFLLCIYGVEIYQFRIVTENLSANFDVNEYVIAVILITLMITVSRRGVNHVGHFASIFVPFFIICYLAMGSWVLYQNIALIPGMLRVVIESAFTGHAAMGAFAGSTILIAASQGMRRSCYAGDIAVGYASVIHSETAEKNAEKQASLAILEIFLDSFVICTTSIMIVLVTGIWQSSMPASMLVQTALSNYFPGMHIFMPLFLLMLGFTTIISYFCAGIKCAEYMAGKIGRKAYYVYATIVCLAFVFLETSQALATVSITAALLLMLNVYAIFRLRDEIGFCLVNTKVYEEQPEIIKKQIPLEKIT